MCTNGNDVFKNYVITDEDENFLAYCNEIFSISKAYDISKTIVRVTKRV